MRGSVIVTAGDDGYLRMWPWTQLEFAEVSEDDPFIRLEPLQEVRLGPHVRCLSLCDGGDDEWLVQDAAGAVHSYHTIKQQTRQLLSCHAGAIHGLAVSPAAHVAVTAGQDRSLRCWDLYHGTALYSRTFSSAVTALHWAPLALDPAQTALWAGFEDGTVRCVHRYLEAFVTAASHKPHRAPVTHLGVSPSGRLLASVSAQGDLFFFALPAGGRGEGAQALGCVKLGERVYSLCWDVVSSKVLLGLACRVLEITAPDPDPESAAEARDSYVLTLPQREWRPDLRQGGRAAPSDADALLAPEPETERRRGAAPTPDPSDEEVERDRLRRERREERRRRRREVRQAEDERPYDVVQALYCPHSTSTFYFALAPPAGSTAPYPAAKVEALYEASFDSPAPLRVIPLGPGFGPVYSLSLSPSLAWLLIGSAAGCVQVRGVRDPLYFLQCHEHDAGAAVRGVAMSADERLLVSAGADGGFFAYVVDPLAALASADRSVESLVHMDRERCAEERRERQRKRAEEEERRRKERKEQKPAGKKEEKARQPVALGSDSESDEGEEAEEDLSHLSTQIDAAPVVVTSQTPAESATVLLPTPTVDALPTSLAAVEAVDGLGAASYSIEEAQAKAEEDERQKELTRAQWRVEEEMAECRAQWQQLRHQRAQWEERVKDCHLPLLAHQDDPQVAAAVAAIELPSTLLDLDPALPSHVAALTDAKVAALQQSLAYDVELHQRRLAKLKAAFLDPVEAEAFVVRAFDLGDSASPTPEPPLSVWSYRVARMPAWLTAELAAHQQRREDEEAQRRKAAEERQRREEAEGPRRRRRQQRRPSSPRSPWRRPPPCHPPSSPVTTRVCCVSVRSTRCCSCGLRCISRRRRTWLRWRRLSGASATSSSSLRPTTSCRRAARSTWTACAAAWFASWTASTQ